jgi:hypothetical protein
VGRGGVSQRTHCATHKAGTHLLSAQQRLRPAESKAREVSEGAIGERGRQHAPELQPVCLLEHDVVRRVQRLLDRVEKFGRSDVQREVEVPAPEELEEDREVSLLLPLRTHLKMSPLMAGLATPSFGKCDFGPICIAFVQAGRRESVRGYKPGFPNTWPRNLELAAVALDWVPSPQPAPPEELTTSALPRRPCEEEEAGPCEEEETG